MRDVLKSVQSLVRGGDVHVSRHGFRELAADDILLEAVVAGISAAILIEEYPAYAKGPSVLVLQHDYDDRPIHVVWGIAKDRESPAVLITAYRPASERWSADFTRRKKP